MSFKDKNFCAYIYKGISVTGKYDFYHSLLLQIIIVIIPWNLEHMHKGGPECGPLLPHYCSSVTSTLKEIEGSVYMVKAG